MSFFITHIGSTELDYLAFKARTHISATPSANKGRRDAKNKRTEDSSIFRRVMDRLDQEKPRRGR